MTSNTQNSKQNRIDVNQSPIMNEDQMQLFLNVRRSRSDQSLIGRFFGHQIQAEKQRPLIISFPNPTTENADNGIKLFRKKKKEKKKNQSDYCKNICGYITKKIIRQLCSPNYLNHVKGLCNKYQCEYQQIKSFYLPKIEQVTGPSHIPSLLLADNRQDQKIKQVFKQFFQWFIKCRYLRYLLNQGKMSDKKAYIKYKNHMLLSMLNQSKNPNVAKISIEQESQQQQQDNDQQVVLQDLSQQESQQQLKQSSQVKSQNNSQEPQQKTKNRRKQLKGQNKKKEKEKQTRSKTKKIKK